MYDFQLVKANSELVMFLVIYGQADTRAQRSIGHSGLTAAILCEALKLVVRALSGPPLARVILLAQHVVDRRNRTLDFPDWKGERADSLDVVILQNFFKS